MTARNRRRLLPFRDDRVLGRVLGLPARLCEEVERAAHRLGASNATLARLWQTAVLVEIELAVPLRLANLAGLRLGRHLVRLPSGATFLVLEAEETKGGVPLEVELPAGAAAMIDRYVGRYRPLLLAGGAAAAGAAGSDWLFPGRAPGRPKSHDGIRDQITGALAERCGVAMHPHLFRHLAGLLILRHDPGAHGLVQRVLGHKTIATTMGFYTGLETADAFGHYQQVVLRDPAPTPGQGPNRGPRRGPGPGQGRR